MNKFSEFINFLKTVQDDNKVGINHPPCKVSTSQPL